MIHPEHGDDARRSWRPMRRSRADMLARDRARGRRRLVQLRDRRRRHVDQRQLRDRRDRQGAARADRARRPIRGSRRSARRSSRCAVELAQAIVRDGEGATKFIAIRVDGGTIGRRMPARRVRHRAFAARQDRVVRVRPQPRPHRLRDRQRRGARPRSVARLVLARRRARRRPRRARRRRIARRTASA